ncbi:DoxX family protein [Novosphingobium resinovorum]|uniref:DoxX family protein n=1 Tax=Novosphingobium resinovorum TaxID=158500 RepID=UPI002ED27031|nr:DoxX family protein [Novosphingobium resinovorum]
MSTAPSSPTRASWTIKRAVDWVIRILLALAFLAAGGAKVAGAPPMVAIFEQIGAGQWFRFVTGILEIVGGLLVPRTSMWGALLLACDGGGGDHASGADRW